MFSIKIADLIICIYNHYSYVENMCKNYITTDTNIDFHVEVSQDDILKEQTNAAIPCTLDYCESICVYRAISDKLIHYDAFLMHGACIEYHGKAYAFCAKSGTGKSTHLCLWKKVYGEDVHIINGDKPILRLRDGIFFVYGTPWCGKEGWNMNTSAPLKALCFLERDTTNTIEPIHSSQVMQRLGHQILMPKAAEQMEHYLDMMDVLIRQTSCYLLHCNMEEEAARVANETIAGK